MNMKTKLAAASVITVMAIGVGCNNKTPSQSARTGNQQQPGQSGQTYGTNVPGQENNQPGLQPGETTPNQPGQQSQTPGQQPGQTNQANQPGEQPGQTNAQAGAGAGAAAQPGQQSTLQPGSSDQQIEEKIRQAVAGEQDIQTMPSAWQAKVNNGVVTLTGRVASVDDRNKIIAAAKRVAGDENVVNQLKIHSGTQQTPTQVKPTQQRAPGGRPGEQP